MIDIQIHQAAGIFDIQVYQAAGMVGIQVHEVVEMTGIQVHQTAGMVGIQVHQVGGMVVTEIHQAVGLDGNLALWAAAFVGNKVAVMVEVQIHKIAVTGHAVGMVQNVFHI